MPPQSEFLVTPDSAIFRTKMLPELDYDIIQL